MHPTGSARAAHRWRRRRLRQRPQRSTKRELRMMKTAGRGGGVSPARTTRTTARELSLRRGLRGRTVICAEAHSSPMTMAMKTAYSAVTHHSQCHTRITASLASHPLLTPFECHCNHKQWLLSVRTGLQITSNGRLLVNADQSTAGLSQLTVLCAVKLWPLHVCIRHAFCGLALQQEATLLVVRANLC